MNNLVNIDYLRNQGFVKDENAPDGVNRWRKDDGLPGGDHISVTMTPDGTKTLYGMANFHGGDGRINDHRKFNGIALTIDGFEQFMDKGRNDLPDGIRSTRLGTHII